MTSTLESDRLNLAPSSGTASNRVIIQSLGANSLLLTASTPSDVSVTGVNTAVFDGNFNNGLNDLGGHILTFRGERRLTTVLNEVYSVGRGLDSTTCGWTMPRNGTIVAVTLNVQTASTGTVELIGSTSGTITSISLSAATQNTITGLSAAFVANEFIRAQVTSGTMQDGTRIFFCVLLE